MKFNATFAALLFAVCCLLQAAAQDSSASYRVIALDRLDAFQEPGKNWQIAGNALADYSRREDMRPLPGSGIIVNTFPKNGRSHLMTKQHFGDLEIELEFMMANQSNSGVYLQGRYEVQLLDSWRRTQPTFSDAGGIYERWLPEKGNFEGTAPLMNAARAPGLWQQLRIRFRAPRFNAQGEKIRNARFEEVYLNGVLVQQQVEVTGPTGSAMFPDEQPEGPLVFQGDHGPVAFRSIRWRPLALEAPPGSAGGYQPKPILVDPAARPYLLRTFMHFGDEKLTHVLSVGNPNQVHYSYNIKQGALFQVWRGRFLDLTPAWRDRGGMQTGVPRGSLLALSNAPAVAVLARGTESWPEAVDFDSLQSHGYVLDTHRNPEFSYTWKGLQVKDKVECLESGEGLSRTLTLIDPPAGVYCRLASGKLIEKLKNGMYAVDGQKYYIRLEGRYKPLIRLAGEGQELLIPFAGNQPVSYSIIW